MADSGFKVGDPVAFNYRSAKDVQGRIVSIVKKGTTTATTMFAIMPNKEFIHPGEKVPVHRTGAHLRHRS